ncbi:hypothetical protein C0044_31175, partial [Pseudomonas aeruginosa]
MNRTARRWRHDPVRTNACAARRLPCRVAPGERLGGPGGAAGRRLRRIAGAVGRGLVRRRRVALA